MTPSMPLVLLLMVSYIILPWIPVCSSSFVPKSKTTTTRMERTVANATIVKTVAYACPRWPEPKNCLFSRIYSCVMARLLANPQVAHQPLEMLCYFGERELWWSFCKLIIFLWGCSIDQCMKLSVISALEEKRKEQKQSCNNYAKSLIHFNLIKGHS